MKYLGSISGRGVLQHEGVAIADATYELEGYIQGAGSVTGSGEIGLERVVAGEPLPDEAELQLLTRDGLVLEIKFSDKNIRAGSHIPVDLNGDIKAATGWRH